MRVSGGTPPYQIQGPATGGIYVPMSEVPEGDSVARLFIIAYDGTNINQGVAGNYLVRDSLGNGCATPFRVWDTPQTQQNLRLEGYHFVQRTLTFDTCTIAKKARVYCYGKPETDPGRPGGRLLGASLVKVSSGDFTIDSGAVIRGQCESMWPGIKVTGPCGPFTRFAMRPGSRIEDAFAGIEVIGAMDSLGFDINKAEFVNNYISLKYDAKTRKRPEIHKSIFRATSGGLKQPFQPGQVHNGSGVAFTSLGGILVAGGTSRTFDLDSCLFSNLFVAIAGGGGPIQIRNSRIEKIRSKGIVLGNLGQTVIRNQIENNELVFDAYPIQGWMRLDTTFEKYGLRREPETGIDSSIAGGTTLIGVVSGGALEINDCQFLHPYQWFWSNSAQRIGAWLGEGNHKLENNTFDRMHQSIWIKGKAATPTSPAAQVSLSGNLMQNIGRKGIWLEQGKLNLSLTCNRFLPDTFMIDTLVGLEIGVGTIIENDVIGGSGNGQGNGFPNANIWPRKVGSTSIVSPDNWISIRKPDAGGLLDYYNFINEFIASTGKIIPETGPNRVRIFSFKTAKSPKAVREWCLANYPGAGFAECLINPQEQVGWSSNWVPVCNNLDDTIEYFARQAVEKTSITPISTGENDQIYLSEPIPNPANEEAEIVLNWPKEKGILVVFDLSTGKRVWSTALEKGKQSKIISLKGFVSGVYGYRLEGECPCPEPKRLIVIH